MTFVAYNRENFKSSFSTLLAMCVCVCSRDGYCRDRMWRETLLTHRLINCDIGACLTANDQQPKGKRESEVGRIM